MSKLWGSRFDKKSDALADKFTFSIAYDKRLAKYDVLGSIAHAQMLGETGIIIEKDAAAIVKGLEKIAEQIEKGEFKFDLTAEDVHTNIQAELKKIVGDAADKLHTARSRNDQVVLDVKMYCMEQLSQVYDRVSALQKSILNFANKNKDVIIPAYTHLQAAQVVLLAHHMLAYIEMLERDKGRLVDCWKRIDVNPLGSCALSGSSLPTNRDYVTQQLGFSATSPNSMDSVSDRDFVIEAIAVLSNVAMHLSRISEDLIIWATKEFDFIDIDASFCTGSSIMPHKKNPDVLELMRGTTSKIFGHLTEVLFLMKGLPLTYNRDMQLDKPPLFDTVETTQDMLDVMAALFANLKVKKASIERRIQDESFFSVDIMEYLIKKGVSYRDAHDAVGELVKECLDKGKKIADLSKADLKRFSEKLDEDVKKLLNPEMSVKIKQSFGSTNPDSVKKHLDFWTDKLT